MTPAAHIATHLLEDGESAKDFILRRVSTNWWNALERLGFSVAKSSKYHGVDYRTMEKTVTSGSQGWRAYISVFQMDRAVGSQLTLEGAAPLTWTIPADKVARRTRALLSLLDDSKGISKIAVWLLVREKFGGQYRPA